MSITAVGSDKPAIMTKLESLRAKCAAQRQRPETAQISRDFISELLEWPKHLRESIDCVCSELAKRPDSQFIQTVGDRLKAVFCDVECLLTEHRKNLARSHLGNGSSAAETNRLENAQEEVARLRADSLENWAWPPSPEEEKELSAEAERGESIALEDAFAAIGGMDRSAWLAKVEARRKEMLGGVKGEP